MIFNENEPQSNPLSTKSDCLIWMKSLMEWVRHRVSVVMHRYSAVNEEALAVVSGRIRIDFLHIKLLTQWRWCLITTTSRDAAVYASDTSRYDLLRAFVIERSNMACCCSSSP